MSYHIQITKSAKKDLKNIGEFHISKYGVDQARKVIKEIQQSILSLQEMPERGHKPHELYDIPVIDFFEIIINKYRIIYKITTEAEKIYVIAIFNGRQDVKSHLVSRLISGD